MNTPRLIITIITNVIWEALIAAGFVWLFPKWGITIPLWGTVLIMIAFAVYAYALYRVGTRTLTKKAIPGSTNMIGVRGRVVKKLAPRGYVRIEGELWEAQAEEGELETGTDVEVTGQRGFKLVVKARQSLT
jgi:membrane protein implicated in regulation of membrane protease activity